MNRISLLRAVCLSLGSFSCWAALPEPAFVEPKWEYVVLIHGLGRTACSMKRLEWTLSQRGYQVINISYPSTSLTVEQAAEWLRELIALRIRNPDAKIHFVTHSLGGIVLRQFWETTCLSNAGRAVMLAPPNQGSESVDALKCLSLFRRLTGPAGQQLGTDPFSLPARLGGAAVEVGIIAGDRSCNPWLSRWIPGSNDGKVSVNSTRMAGMRDFLRVHRSHTWIMWDKAVALAVVRFLEQGQFTPSVH